MLVARSRLVAIRRVRELLGDDHQLLGVIAPLLSIHEQI